MNRQQEQKFIEENTKMINTKDDGTSSDEEADAINNLASILREGKKTSNF